MSNLGWGEGLQNIQQVLAQALALRQQKAQEAESTRRFDLQMKQDQEQFNSNRDFQDAQVRQQGNRWGIDDMRQQRKDMDLEELLKDPSMAGMGPRVRAGLGLAETPREKAEREAGLLTSAREFESNENRLQREGAANSAANVANIYAGSRNQNTDSPASRWMRIGMPSLPQLIEQLGDQETAMDVFMKWNQQKYEQGRAMFPNDPMYAPAPGAPAGPSIGDRIRAAVTGGQR